MKIRISDRILTVILAVVFLMIAAAIVAESAFGADLSSHAVMLLRESGALWISIRVIVITLCLLLAWFCLRITFRRPSYTDVEFVEQKTEGGVLRVSVKALEGLVRKCVANHEEMTLSTVRLESRRNGLNVRLTCQTAADISIPLAVTALQKQLREYIMESTGVSLGDIQVSIDDAQAELAGGTYRLHETVIDPETRTQPATAAVPAQAEEAEAVPAVTEAPAEGTEDEAASPDTADPADGNGTETMAENAPAISDDSQEIAEEPVTEGLPESEETFVRGLEQPEEITQTEEVPTAEETAATEEAAPQADTQVPESPAEAAPEAEPAAEDGHEKRRGLSRLFGRK